MPDDSCVDAWLADVTALAPAADPAAVRRAGGNLMARWAEPHRRYHTSQHLTEMLSALDTLGAAAGLDSRSLSVARVAAWLHDAVYDVHAAPGGSERASADLARDVLTSLGVGDEDVRLVEDLILLTIEHDTGLPGPLADAFTDADLAILAARADRFDEYCIQVRGEYAHVPEAAYATARSAILTALVDRPDVYRTALARAGWTRAARRNVRRELSRLRLRTGPAVPDGAAPAGHSGT